MTRDERFKALADLFQRFTVLLDEVPVEHKTEVRRPFCDAAGRYLEVMEEANGTSENA